MGKLIDDSVVRHVARLARLRVSDDEVAMFAAQLSQILDYFDQMQEVDTEDVSPATHPLPSVNVFREDVAHASWPLAQALANAPDPHDGFFRVPRVLDQETA